MKILFLALFIAIQLNLIGSLLAQTVSSNSAITYQGRLVNPNGSPLTGNINLTFSIYDSLSTGTGNLLCQQIISNTTLENGVFNVSLNFDSSYPSGDCNLSEVLREKMNAETPLYIEVIHSSGSTTKTYPRQLLTSVPYALAVVNQAVSDLNLKGISTHCASGKILKADGNGGFTCTTATSSFAESTLPTCTSGQALTGNGSALSCITIASSMAAGSIGTTEIADSSVTTNKINNLAVTNGKLAADAVTSAKILDGTIANADLANPQIYVTPGNGITGGGTIALGASTSIAVDADDITLGFTGNKLQIKAGAVVSGVTQGVAASNIYYNPNHFTSSGADQFNLNIATSGGLNSGISGLLIDIDAGSAIEINGSNSLDIKTGGITGTHIATGTITNNKIDNTISLTVGDVSTTNIGAFNAKNINGTPSEIRFYEGTPNGTNYIGFRAPYSLASDVVWTLPSSEGSPSAILTTNGAGVLSWSNIGSVDSAKITDGSIVDADIANGTISLAKLNSMSSNTVIGGYNGTPSALTINGDIAPTASSTNLTLMIGADSITSAKIIDSAIMDADINPTAAIDASKLSTGIVSNTEFDTLDGINGTPIQTQFSAKQDAIVGTDNYTMNNLTLNGYLVVGVATPTVKLEVESNTAIKVGYAYLSSGGDYAHLANHEWYDGTTWNVDGTPGAMYQLNGQQHLWYKHDGAGTNTLLMQLDASGGLTAGAFYYSSDKRLKKNITTLDHSLPKLLGVDSVQFNWNKEVDKDRAPVLQYGFIAQNLQKIFPNLVQVNTDGYLKVNYLGMISPIVQSIKEFYGEFASLRKKVNRMEKENAEMKAEIQELREMIEQQQKNNK